MAFKIGAVNSLTSAKRVSFMSEIRRLLERRRKKERLLGIQVTKTK